MKSIKNYLLAVLALAVILTVVSCKNKAGGPSEVASYTCSEEEGVKLTFYDNGTFCAENIYEETADRKSFQEGTYTRNLNKNGTITLVLTKSIDIEERRLPDGKAPGTATVSDNGKKLKFDEGVVVYIRD